MSILINGKSGFVGSNVFAYLKEKQYHVESFSFRNNPKLEIIEDHISTVIHLTGKAHDLKKVSNPDEYYQVNVALTKQIFDSFLNSEATVFITLSSVKAVADVVEGILTEEVNPNPQTHYGKSKLLAEEYIFSKQIPPNKKVYVLRPCMIHGKGNKGNLNLLYNVVKKRIPYPLADFDNKRSFLSIENLCFIMNELIERTDIPSGIYNVADELPISTIQLVTIMSEELGLSANLWKINKKIIYFFAKIGDSLSIPFNSESLQKLTENYVVSTDKLHYALGKTLPLSSEQGLRLTLRSFKNEK
jgi:nucleoside-diphosphate-sugar epimerase